MAAPSARAPPRLPGEIVEDILIRFPPDHPAHLVRAALVCKHWSLLIAGRGFRRRYRQRHRQAPVLGLVANLANTGGAARFVPTRCAYRPARADRHGYRAHDARHGRVLLNRIPAPHDEEDDSALAVWDPIAGEQSPLPLLLRPQQVRSWNAAVLCAARDCDHLDCRAGHFLVAFVGIDAKEMFTHVYSSASAAWSEATTANLPGDDQLDVAMPGVLARDALYFLLHTRTRILKCDPATREMPVVRLLSIHSYGPRIVLMTMADGGLGFAQVDLNCTPRIWSMKIRPDLELGGEGDAGVWVINRAIDLKTQLFTPPNALGFGASPPCVAVASADGAGVIFLKTNDGLYTFDLKSDQAVKVDMSSGFYDIIPFISFYTPAPPQLPDEIVEDVLLRFPPDHPAHLVRAALVCKHWSRLIAGGDFRRRYGRRSAWGRSGQRHREPPVLGLVANLADTGGAACFVPTGCAFRPARADRHGYRAHDARHGHVLLNRIPAPHDKEEDSALAVWDPIAGEQQPLPLILRPQQVRSWNAAVLCAGRDCDHLDCRAGHFLVAFVGIDAKEMFAHVYSSESATWSVAATANLPGDDQLDVAMPGVLARDALYFMLHTGTRILKCDPATREMSVVRLPNIHSYCPRIALMTMADGGLGFAQVDLNCTLRIWSMKIRPDLELWGEGDAGVWVISRCIDLKTQLTMLEVAHDALNFHVSPCVVVAFADGAGVIFLKTNDGLYSFDLKSDQAVKVYMSSGFYDIIPYVSFYTPVLRVSQLAIAGEGPSAGPSTA